MLSQPIPLYLKQAFEFLWNNHPYVDFCNHVFYPALFSMMLLSEWIYLWKLSMTVKRLLWLSMLFLQYKLWYKGSDQNISTICLLFSDQEQRFAITNHDFLCAPLLWLLCLLQVKLYKGKLLSIMTCVLTSVILLVRILFIDTLLHKLVVMFTEFSFAWGQARSKLGGSWYVHFASLFYIIIYYYSLIYFIFRDDTYVISSILHAWWLLENSLPKSGFC
jgi:hypothetical protein